MMNQDAKEMMNQVGNTDTITQLQLDPNSLEVFFNYLSFSKYKFLFFPCMNVYFHNAGFD